jgi:hypothetical protein
MAGAGLSAVCACVHDEAIAVFVDAFFLGELPRSCDEMSH